MSSMESIDSELENHQPLQKLDSAATRFTVSSARSNASQVSQSTRLRQNLLTIKRTLTQDIGLEIQPNEEPLVANMEGQVEEEIAVLGRKRTNMTITDAETQNDDEEAETQYNDAIPDGGVQAWMCAVSALMLVASSWGSNSGYGVFLEYYMNNGTFKGATEYDFALVGCIVVCLAQVLAPLAILLTMVFGLKQTLILGTVIQFVGYLLASFSTKIWQIYLTQGVIVGVSFSLVFIPGTLVIPQWFLKKRGVASGLVTSGAGLGGIIFSLSVRAMISRTGSQRWPLRYLAIATTAMSSVATLMIRERTKRTKTKNWGQKWALIKEQTKIMFDYHILTEFSPLCVGFWFGFMFLGYCMELYTLSAYSTSIGLTASQGSALTAIFNAGQVVGRPSMGLLSDSIGRINFTVLITTFNFLIYFAWWLKGTTTYGSLIAFAFVTGCTMGVGSVMMQPLAADNVSSHERYPAAYSVCNILVGMYAIWSETVSLALRKPQLDNPYYYAIVFGGTAIAVAVLISLSLREWKVRQILRKNLHKEKTQEQNETLEVLLRNNVYSILVRTFYPMKI